MAVFVTGGIEASDEVELDNENQSSNEVGFAAEFLIIRAMLEKGI